MKGHKSTINQSDFRLMKAELSNAGWGLLFCSVIMLGVLFIIVHSYGSQSAPALLVGGVIGLTLPMLRQGRPALVGHLFANFPKELSVHEQELNANIVRLRKRWLMVLVNLPYFAAVILYMLLSPMPLAKNLGDYVAPCLIAFFYVFGVAYGEECLQVLWDLKREENNRKDSLANIHRG